MYNQKFVFPKMGCKLAIIFFLLLTCSYSQTIESKSRISGLVLTYDNIRLAADITLNCNGRIIKGVSDENGKYEFIVDSGMCSITVNLGNYFQFRRASFMATNSKTTYINIWLVPKHSLIYTETVGPDNELQSTGIKRKEPLYEAIRDCRDSQIQYFIQYETKILKRNIAIYNNVSFSQNDLYIKADKLTFNLRNRELSFSGGVEIDKETFLIVAENASLDCKSGKLKLGAFRVKPI